MGARGGQEQLRNPGLTLATGREQPCRIRGGRPAGLLDAKFFRIHPVLSAEACGLGGRAGSGAWATASTRLELAC
jgi:hypothetical protein